MTNFIQFSYQAFWKTWTYQLVKIFPGWRRGGGIDSWLTMTECQDMFSSNMIKTYSGQEMQLIVAQKQSVADRVKAVLWKIKLLWLISDLTLFIESLDSV